MKKLLMRLVVTLALVVAASYAWTHRRHLPIAAGAEPAQSEATYTEEQEAQKMVTVTGPMADYVLRQRPSDVETLQPASHKASAADHVEGSPVGTSTAILHKNFGVRGIVDVPFDIPAHASNPQLRGTYRSFVQQGGVASSDSMADVEFLLLNEQEYSDLLNGRPGDALFSADNAHDGEVNFNLPPTFGKVARYYLVFRNSSTAGGKKIVQADFRVDF